MGDFELSYGVILNDPELRQVLIHEPQRSRRVMGATVGRVQAEYNAAGKAVLALGLKRLELCAVHVACWDAKYAYRAIRLAEASASAKDSESQRRMRRTRST